MLIGLITYSDLVEIAINLLSSKIFLALFEGGHIKRLKWWGDVDLRLPAARRQGSDHTCRNR
jgi:hypothetical protein